MQDLCETLAMFLPSLLRAAHVQHIASVGGGRMNITRSRSLAVSTLLPWRPITYVTHLSQKDDLLHCLDPVLQQVVA
jgi:hypothetical protein